MFQLTCFRGFSIGNFIFSAPFFRSIKSYKNQLGVGAKFCKIAKVSSLTSSVNHECVNVGVNWAINASKNRIVCLSRAPSFFFPSASLGRAVSPHTLRLMSPSPSCATAHLFSHTNARKHTLRCCGSETQLECDRTLLRYASRKIGKGRAPPIDTQSAPLHLQSPLTIRNESRLSTSSSGSHLKIKSSHTYSCAFPPQKV